MSSTNKTTYYGLSQYVGTDIINPLTDFNGDNEKIDTALHNIAEAAGSSAADITALTGRVTTDEGKITALENQNGNDVLVTTAQTLTGAVNELKAVNDTQNTNIAGINSSITGINSSLNEINSTLANHTSKITNIENDIEELQNRFDIELASVTADGVKNNTALTQELLSGVEIDKTALNNYYVEIYYPASGDYGLYKCTNFNESSNYGISFTSTEFVTDGAFLVNFTASGKWERVKVLTTGVVVEDIGSITPANGVKMTLYETA